MDLSTVGAIVCTTLFILLGLIFSYGKEDEKKERQRRAAAAREDAKRIAKRAATTSKEWENA